MRHAAGGDQAGYVLSAALLDALAGRGPAVEHLRVHTPDPVRLPRHRRPRLCRRHRGPHRPRPPLQRHRRWRLHRRQQTPRRPCRPLPRCALRPPVRRARRRRRLLLRRPYRLPRLALVLLRICLFAEEEPFRPRLAKVAGLERSMMPSVDPA
ncbi:MAG: hypothetical protein AVDCRST_MAG19-4998 [uncultured Thermomicrobiales bacterium]|uniref:Uncharacterized protein n=1 Tax=uncultured Thermomicrobiales bacterium TaxID=1645740 RepID=A0A6J4VSQ6_9BACT|nr:MAG: hypothetical protein AVDCRST_MAG19-4998 [uncultured Thermomicrobiales bacterium]